MLNELVVMGEREDVEQSQVKEYLAMNSQNEQNFLREEAFKLSLVKERVLQEQQR
jgi:hypothetical protein